MFRRKEENAADYTSDNSVSGSQTSAASGSETAQTSSSAASANQSIYQITPRANSETPAAPARTGNYRPSPVAEFNRNLSSNRQTAPHAAGNVSEKHASKSASRILTVGNDILLKGEIATCDRIIIEGRVEAKLNEVHTVEISASGSFKGTAEVQDAEVSGLFEGDLIVRNRLVIYSTGEVRGNITYGEIEVERGGKLMGQIKTGSSAGEKPTLLDVLDKKSRKEAAEA